ncbi:MAG: hypothetical protein JKY49_07440, partial [Cohaesibacteraceae bacterium]|nr:hypothetical protein [Cohaesibacteraceae bacterium]
KTGQNRSSSTISASQWLLLNSPAYATLYHSTYEETRKAQVKLLSFQERLDQVIETAKQDLNQSIANAVTLPDGRKAHLDKDGFAWTINNERVDDAVTTGINWEGTEPRESHLGRLNNLQFLLEMQTTTETMGLRLGEIADTAENDDPPHSMDELNALKDESKVISEQLDVLSDKLNSTFSPSAPVVRSGNNLDAIRTANIVPVL